MLTHTNISTKTNYFTVIMNLRSASTLLLLMVSASWLTPAFAQTPATPGGREQWIAEIRTYKHDFLIKELALTREQQNRFLPLYDEMEDKIEELNSDTRELETRVIDDPNASDVEVRNAARTIFEMKKAEGEIEMEYFEKFKDILEPRQLLRLKSAERRFTQRLVNSHRNMRRGTTR